MDNFTQDDKEVLISYMDGELSNTEKLKVEERFHTDKDFRTAYDNILFAREAVKQFGLKEKVAAVHKEMMNELKTPVRQINPARKIIRYSMSVAAALILVVGSFMLYNFFTLSADKVFNSKYQSYVLSTTRSTEEKESSIALAYREKKYNRVINLFESGVDSSSQSVFLAGVSALEMKDNLKAIGYFKKLLASNQRLEQKPYNDEAEYHLALSYIRNGDYDLSLEILEKIKLDASHIYNTKVTSRFLRQIRLLKRR